MQIAPAMLTAPSVVAPRPGNPWPMPKATLGVETLGLVVPAAPAAPLFNFPGIKAGDTFNIAKGSKVGFIVPTGTANISLLEADRAAFRILAAAFGQKVDLTVTVQRISPELVRITQQPAGGGAPTSAEGRIVVSRENYSEFVSTDGKADRTVISHDGKGQVVIDTVIPTFGKAHLVLQRG
jgi:hypothetical protein